MNILLCSLVKAVQETYHHDKMMIANKWRRFVIMIDIHCIFIRNKYITTLLVQYRTNLGKSNIRPSDTLINQSCQY